MDIIYFVYYHRTFRLIKSAGRKFTKRLSLLFHLVIWDSQHGTVTKLFCNLLHNFFIFSFERKHPSVLLFCLSYQLRVAAVSSVPGDISKESVVIFSISQPHKTLHTSLLVCITKSGVELYTTLTFTKFVPPLHYESNHIFETMMAAECL